MADKLNRSPNENIFVYTYSNTSSDDRKKMFRTVNVIRATTRPPHMCVRGTEGHWVGTDQGKTDTIRKWFEQHFKVPIDGIADAFS